jgi:tRNA(adenine34) deaminase
MPRPDGDDQWMRRALRLAQDGATEPGAAPIGCVIVMDNEIIGEGLNEVDRRHDPTAHAEIVAMRRAGAKLASAEMRGAVLYTTLQPCGMCTMASLWAKVSHIVFGAGRDDVHEMYFEDRDLDTMDFIRNAYRNDLTIEGGLLKDECAKLYVGRNARVPTNRQFNR